MRFLGSAIFQLCAFVWNICKIESYIGFSFHVYDISDLLFSCASKILVTVMNSRNGILLDNISSFRRGWGAEGKTIL